MKNLINISEEVKKAVKKSNRLREGILFGEWKKVMGKLAKKSVPLRIKERTLIVGVEDSTYMHHMTLKRVEYIKKVNELLNGDYIENIRFKISVVKSFEYIEEVKKKKKNEPLKNILMEKMSLEEKVQILKEIGQERERKLLEEGCTKCKKCGKIFVGSNELCKVCLNEKNGGKVDDNK